MAPLARLLLARGGGSCRGAQLAVRRAPDLADAGARADKEGRRCQGHEGHEQRILDQVLALIVHP